MVEDLARLAGGAEPPALDDAVARRMIERALHAASTPERMPARASRAWPLVAVALACAVAIAWWLPREREPAPAPQLSRVALPTGDRLVGEAGARFDLERVEPAERRVRLRAGTMLFDVAHVVAGQRFEVATDEVVVVAKGTVFSVTSEDGATSVHVYEGAVEVIEAGASEPVGAGQSWSTHARPLRVDRSEMMLAAQISIVQRASLPPAPPPPRVGVSVSVGVSDLPPPKPPTPTRTPTHLDPRPTPPPPPEPADDELAAARADLAAGRFDAVLAKARGHSTGEWYLVLGDSLRGLGRAKQAADAYDLAAGSLTGTERAEAGYSAAYVRFRELHDGDGALAALAAAGVADLDSPLEERGLALRTQVLVELGRHAEAADSAHRYLARFPHGDLQAFMTSVAKRP